MDLKTELEATHKIMAQCSGQLAGALARRRLNFGMLVELVEQVKSMTKHLEELLEAAKKEREDGHPS